MANYRRNFVPGGSFFFTVNLADRRSWLLIDRIDLLRGAIKEIQERFPFSLDAIVVLPNHLHAIWTLADADTDYATRWRMIKSAFSRGIEPAEPRSKSRIAKRERGIWQRRYWEHTLKDERDFERHCDCIHYNPVKHGCVAAANDWVFSSFRRFVERGIYPMDWVDASSTTTPTLVSDEKGNNAMGFAALYPSYIFLLEKS